MSFTLQRVPGHQARDAPCFALAHGALHEVHAAAHADAACLSGFALMLWPGRAGRPLLWVRACEHDREAGSPCPSGLAELGLAPSSIILVRPRDPASALQAALEGARCAALGAVIVELWGEVKAYDLTASRRLALAAKASGVPVFLLRTGAAPMPSAAETRWQIQAAPSQALPANAPGRPAFQLILLRARNGLEGAQHQLEWDRDAREFISRKRHDIAAAQDSGPGCHAALPGAVASVSFDRPSAPQPWREAG